MSLLGFFFYITIDFYFIDLTTTERVDDFKHAITISIYHVYMYYTLYDDLLKYMIPSCNCPSTHPWSAASWKYL